MEVEAAAVPVPLMLRLVNPRDHQFIELIAFAAGSGYRLNIAAGTKVEPVHATETYPGGSELLARINGLIADHRRAGYVDAIDIGPRPTAPIVYLPPDMRPN